MHNLTDIHDELVQAKKAYTLRLSASKADPFALLSTFVQGTGDLFPLNIRHTVARICADKDVKGYLELASTLDGFSKKYEPSSDVELVRGHRALCSLLKKFPFSDAESPYDTKQNAIVKWQDAERQCGETNIRLRNYAESDLPQWVHHARRLIHDTIGDLTPARIMKMLRDGEHGKGTTTECPFRASTVYHKYKSTELFATSSAKNYAKAAISLNRRWYDYLDREPLRKQVPNPNSSAGYVESQLLDDVISICESERISFVMKDAKTMRPIGIGNSLNMYVQLGIKRELTRCLQRVGVDLTDQTKNQELARMGSIQGCFDDRVNYLQQSSTIDLASASDTVSIGICELLLDPLWFGFLFDLRHESGVLEGDTIVYNKMSAMGNGFTFPLESLLFWAIARATAEVQHTELDSCDLAVYGDDIICPLWLTHELIENLQWSGFSVNTEKSFIDGPFKESCGADYFSGINVRPFYLKRRLTTAKDIYHVCNALLPRTLDLSDRVSQGYRAIYQFLTDVVTQQGPVIYRPLSDIIKRDPSGRMQYFDCERGLCVPLSFFNEAGIGYLTTRQKVRLFPKWFPHCPKKYRNATLSSIIRNNVPYTISISERAKAEKGVNESLRLATALQSKETVPLPDPYSSHSDRYCIQADGVTRITVKGGSQLTFKLQPVPNWDGPASKGLLVKHPCWT
jgi:hypothetical protein